MVEHLRHVAIGFALGTLLLLILAAWWLLPKALAWLWQLASRVDGTRGRGKGGVG